jgi:hypothetical protein
MLFGGDRQMSIHIDSPLSLLKGAGLHRLLFVARLDTRNTMTAGVPIDLRGEAWLGSGGGDWLGMWWTPEPVVSRIEPFEATLILPLTDEQLAVIEQRRAGSDLTIQLDVRAVLGYDPAHATGDENDRWPGRKTQLNVPVQAEAWVRLLAQSSMASSLAVVVPVPLAGGDARYAKIGDHLREAIRKVNAGEYADAAVAARRALDVLSEEWPHEAQVRSTPARERTLGQRLGLLRDALYSLAGAAPHGDSTASAIGWDRERSLAVIAATAALCACAK